MRNRLPSRRPGTPRRPSRFFPVPRLRRAQVLSEAQARTSRMAICSSSGLGNRALAPSSDTASATPRFRCGRQGDNSQARGLRAGLRSKPARGRISLPRSTYRSVRSSLTSFAPRAIRRSARSDFPAPLSPKQQDASARRRLERLPAPREQNARCVDIDRAQDITPVAPAAVRRRSARRRLRGSPPRCARRC